MSKRKQRQLRSRSKKFQRTAESLGRLGLRCSST